MKFQIKWFQYFVELTFSCHFPYLPFYENYTQKMDIVMNLDLMDNALLDDSI